MISEIPNTNVPAWLESLADGPLPAAIPLLHVLRDSLYYPACGFNGTPVKYLTGNVHSYVYADYGVTKSAFMDNLLGSGPDSGFKGYRCVHKRDLAFTEVVPPGWRPTIVPHDPEARERLHVREKSAQPFGHWSIWEQRDSSGPTQSRLFSFVYLGAEMSATYQGLYVHNSLAPKILALIQPGSMGGEWEKTDSDDSFFKTVVASNGAGLPEYLLYGGYGIGSYEEACWSEYRGDRVVQLPERYAGLWKRR